MISFNKITLKQTNCYLLKVKEGYLLIDCGNVGDEYTLITALSKLGLSFASLKYILITHHHSDHCGLLQTILKNNPNIIVILSNTCALYLKSGQNYSPPEERFATPALKYAFTIFEKLGGTLSNTFPSYQIRNNDFIIVHTPINLLALTGIDMLILSTPGHTNDSITLIQEDSAFVGDAARNIFRIFGSPYEPICQYDHFACYESWKDIISHGVKYIHPSHGDTFPIERLILHLP